jgi:hypothetical protein
MVLTLVMLATVGGLIPLFLMSRSVSSLAIDCSLSSDTIAFMVALLTLRLGGSESRLSQISGRLSILFCRAFSTTTTPNFDRG